MATPEPAAPLPREGDGAGRLPPAGGAAERRALVGEGAERLPEWRWREGRAQGAGSAELAVELPVALEFNGIAHAVMLATPLDLEDFAVGFSLAEGIVAEPGEIFAVEVRAETEGLTVALDIAGAAFAGLKSRRRSLAGRTGCGLCGTESLSQVVRPVASLPAALPCLAPSALARALATLAGRQPLSQRTGSTHGAAWCGFDGTIALVREDVGRHNALDKLVGALARAGSDPAAGFALVTSRASVEMVQKAATARIALLAAVSGPTTLARALAERCGLTLVGFARGRHFSVYTHAQRVAAESP